MNVPFNQVLAFITVAQTGSFAEAAIQLHLSQPALSIAIKNLEDTLGGKLLIRSTRNVSLTPEGKAYFPVAKRLVSDWQQSLEDVHNQFTLAKGKLEVAAMPTYASNILPPILGKFHQCYPDINITVHDVIAEDVVEMVREGRCELGITFAPIEAPDLTFEMLYIDKFIAILPNKHPLLEHTTLTWKALLNFPHISLQRPAGKRLLIDKALENEALSLSPSCETQQLVSVGKLVKAGLGVSVVPSTSQAQMINMGLQYREIEGPKISHQVGIITKRQS